MLKIERTVNEIERRKERLASIVEGKSEGRGLTKKKGWRTAHSVGTNFHFFHLFAPLMMVLKKCHGGTNSQLVDFRSVSSFIGSPPLWNSLYLILSLTSLCLTPFFQSLFHASLFDACARFCSLAEDPLSFSQFIPSITDDLPL